MKVMEWETGAARRLIQRRLQNVRQEVLDIRELVLMIEQDEGVKSTARDLYRDLVHNVKRVILFNKEDDNERHG